MSKKIEKAGTLTVAGHRLSSTGALGVLLWFVAMAPDSLMKQVKDLSAHRCHCVRGQAETAHVRSRETTNEYATILSLTP
jgi:hypothetical protein